MGNLFVCLFTRRGAICWHCPPQHTKSFIRYIICLSSPFLGRSHVIPPLTPSDATHAKIEEEDGTSPPSHRPGRLCRLAFLSEPLIYQRPPETFTITYPYVQASGLIIIRLLRKILPPGTMKGQARQPRTAPEVLWSGATANTSFGPDCTVLLGFKSGGSHCRGRCCTRGHEEALIIIASSGCKPPLLRVQSPLW